MRRLLLMRHAKAERLQPGGRDLDRVLDPRGRADAKTLGTYLVQHRSIPDLALVSTAARTRETWTLVAAVFAKARAASFDDRLYEAFPLPILEVIKQTAEDVGTLLVIGHNPGLQDLATMLVASGDIEARERLGREFPTSALATVSFVAENWSGVHARGGRLEHFVTPRWLETATD
jgi:phosphohistidine phosphatase